MRSSDNEAQQPPSKRTSCRLPASLESVATVATVQTNPKFRSMTVMKPAPAGGLKKSAFHHGKENIISGIENTEMMKNGVTRPNLKETIDADFIFIEPMAEENNGVKMRLKKDVNRDPTIPYDFLVEENSLRPFYSHYTLEKPSRLLTQSSTSGIFSRISDCCRIMSVQAHFNHDAGNARLNTCENVEIFLSLWKVTGGKIPNGVVIEAKRIKGDAVTYHKYCCHILDAADGKFDARDFHSQEEKEKEYYKVAEHMLKSTKDQRPFGEYTSSDHQKSFLALEIAASLLKKDRLDARQLGMESLCHLTNPDLVGINTALIASRVVLTGSAWDESYDKEDDSEQEELSSHVRQAILSLVQFGRLAGDCNFIDEADSDDEDITHWHLEEQEHNNLLHNLALGVLANALDVLKNHGDELATRGTTWALVADAFLSGTDISSQDLLSTLLGTLEAANRNPHDACLSARCLGSLCEASKDARQCAKAMNAESIIAEALEEGRQTHLRLETETEKALAMLQKAEDDEEQE